MKKEILSEIDVYYGTVDMPKYFEINRDELKANLLNSVLKDKSFSNNFVIGNSNDYQMQNGKAFYMFNEYIIQNFFLKHKQSVKNNFNFGSIFNKDESSITKNLIDKYKIGDSPDYTCIYGIEVNKGSQQIILEYSNKRLIENYLNLELKNNEYVIFPSVLNYFFTRNGSDKTNTYMTTTYDLE